MHNVNTERPEKRYLAILSITARGSKSKHSKFQIDTAARCHTISEAALKTYLPDAEI